MNWKKIIGIIVAVAIVGFIGYNVVNGNSKKDSATLVSQGTIKKEKIVEVLSTTGTLIPNNSQSLYGEGNVSKVNVSVGDQVKNGDVLVTYATGLELKAAIDGTITAVNVKNDETDLSSQTSQPSIQIDDLSTLKVQLQLSKSEASEVKKDQTVSITSGSNTYEGIVAEMDPIATTSTSTSGSTTSLKAVITFNQAPENLVAGFDADCDITTATVDNALSLPIEALQYDKKNQPFVYRIVNGKAKKVVITTGIQSDTQVEVKTGLSENDKVILSPDSSIKNGTSVAKK